MGLRQRGTRFIAGQLARPHGLPGHLFAVLLNKHNDRSLRAAVSLVGAAPGEVVADVGFGGGLSLDLLLSRVSPGGLVYGIELSGPALGRAKRHHRGDLTQGALRLHEASITALPLSDAELDAVITMNTLYFVSDLDAALGELARVVKPGGRVLLGVGDPDTMKGELVTAHGFRLRPLSVLTDAMQTASFSIVAHERVGDGEGAYHLLLGRRITG